MAGNGELEHLIKEVAKAHLADRERWQKQDERWQKQDERWQKNDERWRNNELHLQHLYRLIQKQNHRLDEHDRKHDRMMTKLEKHDGHIDAMLKTLYRLLEGRSS